MHGPVKRWTTAAAVAGAVLVGSAGNLTAQGGGNRQVADPPVVAYRKAMMRSNSAHVNSHLPRGIVPRQLALDG